MSRAPVDPADCPEPYWHKTHRYCPACTWTEPPPPACPEHVDVDLISDDYTGPEPHAFPCTLPAGHPMPHAAIVTWLDGED